MYSSRRRGFSCSLGRNLRRYAIGNNNNNMMSSLTGMTTSHSFQSKDLTYLHLSLTSSRIPESLRRISNSLHLTLARSNARLAAWAKLFGEMRAVAGPITSGAVRWSAIRRLGGANGAILGRCHDEMKEEEREVRFERKRILIWQKFPSESINHRRASMGHKQLSVPSISLKQSVHCTRKRMDPIYLK